MKSATSSPIKKSTAKSLRVDGGKILHGDNLPLLRKMQTESVSLIYIDPPFNTGKTQQRTRIQTILDDDGDRTGFGGRRYRTTKLQQSGYNDRFDDYLGFLRPRLIEAHRILAANGSLFFHIDWRESARCRLLLEEIFGGAQHCINEIIWVYDFGARSKKRWSAKHDNIYWFAKNPQDYIYNYDAVDLIEYMSPGLVGKEKSEHGKRPTDAWWNTIVPTNGGEKTGYPTQKPLAILNRIVRVHSNQNDTVLDFFAGSGTTGVAAQQADRKFILMDENREAVDVMKKRLTQKRSLPQKKAVGQHARMLEIFNHFRPLYRPDVLYTASRPFVWIHDGLSPARKGAIGKKIVREFLNQNGFSIDSYKWRGADFTVNGHKATVKLSSLWSNGAYKFQQIRDDDYELLFCLGISTATVNIWVISKSEIVWDDLPPQHGGKQAHDTWWFPCAPSKARYTWMYPQNGDPSAICRHLRRILSESR